MENDRKSCPLSPDLKLATQVFALLNICMDVAFIIWIIVVMIGQEHEISMTPRLIMLGALIPSAASNTILLAGSLTMRKGFLLQWLILRLPILIVFWLPFFLGFNAWPFYWFMLPTSLVMIISGCIILTFYIKADQYMG
ncbi:hypothetical protein TCAL_08865 [Tigriopus californicus]|uniref:Uncharacterized protein n=1 Tax=Tigriopus californicus TaxID=6832 RepID=A0A553N767_TIGCA|nr:uncharacterized protein LOC131885407 [Tigriopus californicus]TRY61277.1 hypothetical protein TCAL_08865 [Tigriopus californicus]|eukprot:TCALIF_08865-PA protein Name:"Protein of unknown function" AED:0.00 eAED:0.00 QI:471/1/1/1/0.5/0.33/3/117/138